MDAQEKASHLYNKLWAGAQQLSTSKHGNNWQIHQAEMKEVICVLSTTTHTGSGQAPGIDSKLVTFVVLGKPALLLCFCQCL